MGSSKSPAIHFFTIVLNGEPFIRHHIDVFSQLPFPWHWHIVEGVAALKHDTAWSVANGGHIDGHFHRDGRSNDGTTEYLDDLQRRFPDRVTVYRKPLGAFWDGKVEMVNAPLANFREEVLLWQVDVDEYWTVDQIATCRRLFVEHPERRAALFWCHYYVGPGLVTTTRDTYGNNSSYEWLRVWRYRSGDRWVRHEPPLIADRWGRLHAWVRQLLRQQPKFRAEPLKVFRHNETEANGLVFKHLAYVIPEQLSFKEHYYGYANALRLWRRLQEESKFPVHLRDYLEWVKDDTLVDRASAKGLETWNDPRNAASLRSSSLSFSPINTSQE
jgi:hypothetical protein